MKLECVGKISVTIDSILPTHSSYQGTYSLTVRDISVSWADWDKIKTFEFTITKLSACISLIALSLDKSRIIDRN
jgi:hypothetical protein